jgi:hypothetical protein
MAPHSIARHRPIGSPFAHSVSAYRATQDVQSFRDNEPHQREQAALPSLLRSPLERSLHFVAVTFTKRPGQSRSNTA